MLVALIGIDARGGAADVDEVAPLRRVADEVALEEDRPQQQEVRRVGDRALAHVRVVERDDVAVAQVGDLVGRVLEDRRDRASRTGRSPSARGGRR